MFLPSQRLTTGLSPDSLEKGGPFEFSFKKILPSVDHDWLRSFLEHEATQHYDLPVRPQVMPQFSEPEHRISRVDHEVSGLDALYADLGYDHLGSLHDPGAGSPDHF